MENDKSEEKPKMSRKSLVKNEAALEREAERKSLVKNEANAVRRAIKIPNWRHELQSRNTYTETNFKG